MLTTLVAASSAAAAAAAPIPPKSPIRAAFYYPWYTGHWRDVVQTNFHPALGFYRSTNRSIISKHIRAMRYGGIKAGIASWWGKRSYTDQVFPRLFSVARGTPFRWGVLYEDEGYGDPSVSRIRSDLHYLRKHYFGRPTFFRVRGRPVVFVWGDGGDRCSMVRRWRAANDVGAYVVLKLFPGYRDCSRQPAWWYEYAPANRLSAHPPYSFSVSPGFWQHGHSVRLPRSVAAFRKAVRAMVRSKARFKLVTTFNEWLEGTAVESALEWRGGPYGRYLSVLHRNGR